jgi:tetratricopeptide (TPR) repeat protein
MRVNVQLIDAEIGSHLWAERFDKPLADLFDMQDEIVARLANQLETQLIAAEARRTKTAPTPDSMDLYFQGMALVNSGVTLELLEQARGFFVRALALDASNVDAMVGLSYVDFNEASAWLVEDRTAHYAAAEATVNKVFAVAPNNAWAHVWMGGVLDGTNRAPRALAELDRALALDPNLTYAYGERARSLIFLGRAEEVELRVNQALRLSPRDNFAFIWMLLAGAAKIHLGTNDQAEAWLRRSIDANPNSPFGHILLAAALANLGKLPEARVEARAGLALNPIFTVHRFQLGAESDNSVFLAQREHLLDGLRKAGLPEE